MELTAVGLEHELDRWVIGNSVVTNDGVNRERVGTVMVFNQDFVRGYAEIGNGSAQKVDAPNQEELPADRRRKTYVFGADKAVWTVRDIVEYLLANFGPTEIPITLGGQADALAAFRLPKVRVEGQTVYQVLCELIDRKRGLGWRLRCDDGQAVTLDVFTTLAEDVDVSGGDDGDYLPANRNQVPLDLDAVGHGVAGDRLSVDSLARYGRIDVVGERIVSCFTVSAREYNLEAAWTPEEEAAYVAATGAKDDPGRDQVRTAEKFRRVYTTFRIPNSWGWVAGGGAGGTKANANPLPNPDGRLPDKPELTSAAPVRKWGHTLLRHLPIKKDGDTTVLEPEYLGPLVLVLDEQRNRYVPLDRPGTAGDVAGSVRVHDRDFALVCDMGANHKLALNHWPASGNTQKENHPKYDYAMMIATVAARTDQPLQVTVLVPGADTNRRLTIQVPDAELHYVVPGTVLDVDGEGNPVASTDKRSDVVRRDDSPFLRQVAALALAWYATPRATLRVTLNDLWPGFGVGTYVTTVTNGGRTEPVNAPVTEVAYDFAAGTTAIATNYGELDFAAGGPACYALK